MARGTRSSVGIRAVSLALLVASCGSTVATTGAQSGTSGGSLGSPSVTGGSTGPISSGAAAAGGGAATANGATSLGAVPGQSLDQSNSASSGQTLPGSRSVAGAPPIKIGTLSYSLASTAFSNDSTSKYNTLAGDILSALIRAVNAAGGVAGRKIQEIKFVRNVSSPDYSSQWQAACARFTQDNHVADVLNMDTDWPVIDDCLKKAGIPEITQYYDADVAHYPGIFSPTNASNDRILTAQIRRMVATGYLSSRNKLGFIVMDCPSYQRSVARSLLPLLQRYHISYVRNETKCFTGYSELAQSEADVQSAVLRFRTEGVDRVMMVYGGNELYAWTLFVPNAESQHWYPGYIMSSYSGAATSNYPSDQAENVHGVGWWPLSDVTAQQPRTARQKQCIALAKAGGFDPTAGGDAATLGVAYAACDVLLLLRTALTVTNGNGAFGAIVPAIESLGHSFRSALVGGGETYFSPTRHDGPQQARNFGYSKGCSCYVYTSAPAPF